MCFDAAECKGDLGEERLEELSQYFHFNLSNDPMYRFRRVLRRIEKWIEIKPISDAVSSNSQSRWHFGLVENLRFAKTESGGVYCDFKDNTGYIPMGFENEYYQSRKYDIEHCDGRWMLALGKSSNRGNNFRTEKFYFGEELLEGSTEGLGTSFANSPISYPQYFLNSKGMSLDTCTNCELSNECRKPVPPTYGLYNMMLVGEAPGKDEDRLGKPFIGAAGNLLWTGREDFKGLNTYGLTRDLFHITNVCKCFPSKTRTPKSIHVRTCSPYLYEEIKAVKPFVILAMGNTGLRFFKGVESGITNLSGTTEWSDEFNCWICYSLHPAAVLHHSENLEFIKTGIENFVKKVVYLGFS
jgi:DNA polymerase